MFLRETIRMPDLRQQHSCKWNLPVLLLFLLPAAAFAQTESHPASRPNGEQGAARSLEVARANPLALRAFLAAMPKGGDLHSHLSGAVYAESWIRAAAEDKLCIDQANLSFSKPQTPRTASPSCGEGKVPALDAFKDQHLYDTL